MATIAGGVSMKRRDLIRQKNKLAKTGGFRISGMRSMRVLPWSYCFWYM